ncbi:FKBP-type peptidyl-prolyl cis-trans isomerase [Fibrella sp. HMF5335]|uniref:Peptidyl-prolyl cis-trans isomerase n=1 Tax=Fibrella rubiginis TaxID=2817060 RepID=A0A939GI82_9BACT|nr:FKBP-type peptidyl-prolyl cis-trans isomerase [Fibrella rubiginis]MBO0937236.1 FKBP-type peptidyl-prolyl cis-trans isomerase [Fibrella rubiginis]
MRKLSLAFVAVFGFAAFFLSCKDTYVDPAISNFAKDTTDITTYIKGPEFSAYIKQNNLPVQTAAYGVKYVITQANPAGKAPAQGDELEFSYVIRSLGGTRIDSTKKDSSTYFPFGLGKMLVGLEIGFGKLREGEKAIFLFPSYVAFGDRVVGSLPANSPVRFDVVLKAVRSEDAQIEDYIARNKLKNVEKQSTGLRVSKTVSTTTGATLTDGQKVTVRYAGKLLRSGTVFDNNSGNTFDVTLGRNQVVPGFEAGIKALKVGEKGTIIFPSSLGYGSTGAGPILPYTPLAFDIEIVSAQ